MELSTESGEKTNCQSNFRSPPLPARAVTAFGDGEALEWSVHNFPEDLAGQHNRMLLGSFPFVEHHLKFLEHPTQMHFSRFLPGLGLTC